MAMEKQTAGVHFQWGTENIEIFDRILDSDKPVLVFLVPVLFDKNLKNNGKDIFGRVYQEKNYYSDKFIERVIENKDNPNMTFIQEGYLHYCERCFEKYLKNNKKYPDPFHEHICINDGYEQSLEEQIDSIENGMISMMDFGIKPDGYEGPNHLHNENTSNALKELGFDYFIFKNLAKVPVYKDNGLVMISESKIGENFSKNSAIIYDYYDNLVNGGWDAFSKVLKNSINNIEMHKKPKFRVWLNQKSIRGAKKFRDLKNKLL